MSILVHNIGIQSNLLLMGFLFGIFDYYELKHAVYCTRDYTNPLLPVASSAIDASGQVNHGMWLVMFYIHECKFGEDQEMGCTIVLNFKVKWGHIFSTLIATYTS